MPFPEDMLDGALNGVPIAVVSRRLRGGRATTLHEFVGRDEPWSEDTGKLPRRFGVTFKVIGTDYLIDRDKILDILESPGPYTYTDPTFGDVQVALEQQFDLEENFDGVADFDVIFHRAGTLEFPLLVEPSAEVKRLTAPTLAAIELAHRDRFSLGKLLKLILRGLHRANTALRIAKSKIAQRLNLIDDFSSEISQLADNINDLAGTPQDFANAFRNLAAQTANLIRTWLDSHVPRVPDGRGFGESNRLAIDVALEMAQDFRDFDAGAGDADLTTPDGVQEQQNLLAIEAMVQQVTFALVADILVDLEPDTGDTATLVKDQMFAWADEILADEKIDSAVYDGLADMLAALINYEVTIGQSLPTERVFHAARPMPACVVSQILYGDGSRDDEIALRNNLRHPLFAEGDLRVIRE